MTISLLYTYSTVPGNLHRPYLFIPFSLMKVNNNVYVLYPSLSSVCSIFASLITSLTLFPLLPFPCLTDFSTFRSLLCATFTTFSFFFLSDFFSVFLYYYPFLFLFSLPFPPPTSPPLLSFFSSSSISSCPPYIINSSILTRGSRGNTDHLRS